MSQPAFKVVLGVVQPDVVRRCPTCLQEKEATRITYAGLKHGGQRLEGDHFQLRRHLAPCGRFCAGGLSAEDRKKEEPGLVCDGAGSCRHCSDLARGTSPGAP